MSRSLSRTVRSGFIATISLVGSTAHAQMWTDSLRSVVNARIAQVPGAVVGVAFHDLGSEIRLNINGDTLFHAASTMKVPVMIEYFRAVDAGRIAANQSVLLLNRFSSIVDGSPYSLDAGDDSDSSLYRLVGTRVSVSQLVERMIMRSSNLATNAVIALVDANAATATAHTLGAPSIRVLRGVEDNLAFRQGLNNVTSPIDLAVLLEAIERRRAASPGSCNAMLAILKRQEFNEEIPAGLPSGTPVAHKTGWITGVLHDAAVVYPPDRAPYVLVVLTKGIPEEKTARALIVDISRAFWQATQNRR
ncbi:MAG: serine hydrolase [Gemmatimonadaceae bacterium]